MVRRSLFWGTGPHRGGVMRQGELRLYGVLRSSPGLANMWLYGRRTLVLFLLHRVVDRLSDDLAVLDQVRVGPIPYPDVFVLVGPLQEGHPSVDRCVGVLEGAMLGELLIEAALEAYLPAPVFGQVEVVVEHFLGRAATEVLHEVVILLHIAEHADHTKMLARQQPRCIPRRVFHQSAWKG